MHCPSDGRAPKRVAILLCVGSRDRQIGREWCSKVCCTVSCEPRHGNPGSAAGLPRLHLLHGYPHVRAVRGQSITGSSQEEFKVKYIKARIAEVTSNGEQLVDQGRGHPGQAADHHPVRPRGARDRHGSECRQHAADLRDVRRRSCEKHGHIERCKSLRHLWRGRRYVAGRACIVAGSPRPVPETIDDSIAQGQAAAMAAYRPWVKPRSRWRRSRPGMFGRADKDRRAGGTGTPGARPQRSDALRPAAWKQMVYPQRGASAVSKR